VGISVAAARSSTGPRRAARWRRHGRASAALARTTRRAALVALAAVVALLAPLSVRAAAADETTPAALQARNDSLRRQLELAESDAFYLLLDPEPPVLRLMYKGAPLRETPVAAAEIGEPRAVRGPGDRRAVDLYAVWSGGTLVPPRIDVREEVIPPPIAGEEEEGDPDGSSGGAQGEFLEGAENGEESEDEEAVVEEVEIPKTPEELYPVPLSYEIRFQEGLSIEVVREAGGDAASDDGDESAGAAPAPPEPGLLAKLAGLWRRFSVSRPEGERARVRLVLASKDADRLFRSLPPDVKLLIRRPGETKRNGVGSK